MPKPFSLQPLVSLAQQQCDATTKKFGLLNQQQQAAQTKLDTLLQYRKDYQIRFQDAMQNGLNQIELRNFQDFILRLDEAIAQQRKSNDHALSLLQIGRTELLAAQRKMKSFDTLAQRHVENEKKLAAKAEQRQQDEHSGRISAIKSEAAENEN